MKKLLAFLLLCMSAGANAQFTPGQLLTAGELNTQFALYAKLAGATFTGPVTIPTLTVSTTATLPAQAANTLLGNVSGSSASPSAVSVSNCSSSSSALSYTSGTGFGCNSSVNAATLGGATFAAPGPIGSGTPSTGAFTNLSSNGTLTLANGSVTLPYLATEAANTVVANFTGSTASPVAFSMPSCTGSSNALGYTNGTGIVCNGSINATTLGGATFASPGSIGSSTAGSGAFTTVTASSTITPSQTAGIVGTTTNNNANAGSIGEYSTANASGVSLTTGTPSNLTSISLTAGDWDVTGIAQVLASGSTVLSAWNCGVSTTSATFGGFGTLTAIQGTLGTGSQQLLQCPVVRLSLSSTTTVYLLGQATFTTSTASGSGFIRARRIR